jgi:hypothetical protein
MYEDFYYAMLLSARLHMSVRNKSREREKKYKAIPVTGREGP